MRATGLVSIVVPCRNEVRHIEGTIRAFLQQDYSPIEILIVDGMSEDGTRAIVERMSKEDARVRLVDNPQKLTPFAFNAGIHNSKGEYVQIVGSRNGMAPDYVSKLVQALNAHPEVACVGGDYQHIADSKAGRLIACAMESKFGVGGTNYRTMSKTGYVDTVGVPMYRYPTFEKYGFFDENLTRNQDDDYNFRLTQAGEKILYVHEAKVTYLVRGSWKKAFNQFSQYGYFKVFVNRKHRAVTTIRQLVPPLFVLFLLVTTPLAVLDESVFALWLGVLLIYMLLGFSLAGRGLSFFDRLAVLYTCAVLHMGYGYGYLMGMLDFLILRRRPRLSFQGQTT